MTNPITAVSSAARAGAGSWGDRRLGDLPDDDLMRVQRDLALIRRLLDAAQTVVASEIAGRSRADSGGSGLARTQGYRTPVAMIAAVTGLAPGEASRFVRLGDAVRQHSAFDAEPLPPRHAHVAAALAAGSIGAPAAAAIVALLDRVALEVDEAARNEAEYALVEAAPGVSLDALGTLILRTEARLDPDGVAAREDALRADRAVHLRQAPNGSLHLTGVFDPEGGAPIKLFLETFVAAKLRARLDHADRDSAPVERQGVPQMQADALSTLAEHALGCSSAGMPAEGATVVVRIDLADLQSGAGGAAEIDGIAAPISAATARRMAAGAGVIPCVMGGDGEILDWGRRKRLFTTAQRLALVERDGGCARCGSPPSHTKVHHLRWWARDGGPTDLDNGVLLCTSCHHRIHDDGWEIRVEGSGTQGRVWFVPPAPVDASRTPVLGGRARFLDASGASREPRVAA
ncbi:DUF222 domain-containing protein [Microbacterium sp. 1P10UB]|uniref:HNH endonuclease n=1 Tax=unclassified Microbacterium TaxID=2609290 RepID=UPI0039A29FE8